MQNKYIIVRPASLEEAGLLYSELEAGRQARPVGRVTYADGEEQIFTDSQTYLVFLLTQDRLLHICRTQRKPPRQ